MNADLLLAAANAAFSSTFLLFFPDFQRLARKRRRASSIILNQPIVIQGKKCPWVIRSEYRVKAQG
jgi:hypothetical protein